MRWSELDSQACSMSRALAIIGDRWTLLILRDCFLRVRRFEDFQQRIGLPRPVLTDRLAKLVDAGVLDRLPYQQRPPRDEYRLSPMGLELYPVILSIVHWGDVHLAGDEGRPMLHRHIDCGQDFDPLLVCSECGEPLDPLAVRVRAGPGADNRRHGPLSPDSAASRLAPTPEAPTHD